MHPTQSAPYSWRQEATVPAFDDAQIVLVMDGACGLCSQGARRIARWDRHEQVRITTAQSPLGQALFTHFGLSPDDPESWLMLENGQAYGGLDAMIRLFPKLRRIWAPVVLLRLLPQGARDWLYARVARNRYALWGHGDLCALPDPELRRRLIN